MKKPFIEIDSEHLYISPFETFPIEGYEAPTNKTTGEKFPMCCKFHKQAFESSEKWFDTFPNCCEAHKKFVGKWWFKKDNYTGLPQKIVKQISFTEHHINSKIDSPDWYKDITDYIDYNIYSFGHPAVGLHVYFSHTKHYIQHNKEAVKSKEKRERLVEYIEGNYNNPKETEKTDLNILYSTYQKWLKTFPFEISYFSNLKQHFEKKLPIISGQLEYNKYLGIQKGKAQTQSGLIEALTNTTKQLLQKIETAELLSKGLIPDTNKHRIELINESHRLKQVSLIGEFSTTETRYVTILKKWLSNEKEYFKEITPLIKITPIQADTSEAEKEKRNYIPLAFSYYYKQSVQEIEWFDNWQGGRENAYKKVVSQHYTNPAKTAWKQFQREYVKIENEHSNNRWQLCSKENYPAILELLKDNPKGLAKAKEELSKAIT